MSLPYWEYFLSIESDLEKCSKYVHFSQNNFDTYSVEFAKIIMTSAAEIDTIAKEICRLINPNSNANNINQYAQTILNVYPNLINLKIEIPRYDLEFKPWDGWSNGTSPIWWREYNDIKHDRTANFEKANLKNSLEAICGLLVMILYYYARRYGTQRPNIDAFFAPKLLSPVEENDTGFTNGGIFWTYRLP